MVPIDEIIPIEVQMDPWLVFHGSSNIYDESITGSGLCPSVSSFSKSELERVAAIFNKLNWCGEHMGGYAVLQPFSISHDHGDERGNPLYLAESARRASLYASADFAGGEVCRALHYCLEDLRKYIEDAGLRENHAMKLERRPGLARVDRESIPAVDWVISEVEKLSDISERVSNLRHSYSYGTIYTIRLDAQNLDDIEYHSSMGIKSYRAISSVELEMKYKLPASFDWYVGQDDRMFKSIFEPGIVKTLEDR